MGQRRNDRSSETPSGPPNRPPKVSSSEIDSIALASLDKLPAQVAILNEDGEIVHTNTTWREFGSENDISGDASSVGQNYIAISDTATDETAQRIADGLRDLLAGDRESLTVEYPCHSPDTKRWFELQAAPFDENGTRYLLVLHVDVTDRKLANRRTTQVLETLQTSVTRLFAADSRRAVGEITAGALSTLFESAVGVVYGFDEEAGVLAPIATTPAAGESAENWVPVDDPDSVAWQAFAEQTPIQVETDGTTETIADGHSVGAEELLLPIGTHGVVRLRGHAVGAFSEMDVDATLALLSTVETVLDRLDSRQSRSERERELDRLGTDLTTLRSLVDLTDDVVRTDLAGVSRHTVERAACEALVSGDLFEVTWIGGQAGDAAGVRARAWASADGHKAEGLLPHENCHENHPASEALETGCPTRQVDLASRDRDQWVETALSHGYRACVSVPLCANGRTHGVLTLYAADSSVVDETATDVLDGIVATAIGHALTTADRTRLLLPGSTTELTIGLEEAQIPIVSLASSLDSEVTLRAIAANEDGSVDVTYAVASVPASEGIAAVDGISNVHGARAPDEDTLVLTQSNPLAVTLATMGCRVESVVADGTGVRATVAVPADSDYRGFVESVRDLYPSAEVLAKRAGEQGTEPRATDGVVEEALTERQREVLETAYHSGYVAQPRETSGEEIADALDITQPTFNQHFWTGLQRLLEETFGPID